MRLSRLLVIVLLAGTLGLAGCGEDEPTPTEPAPGYDPNVFCNEGLCLTNDSLKQQCVQSFNSCIANNPDANDDECVATALLFCRL